MTRTRNSAALALTFAVLLLVFFVFSVPSVNATTVDDLDSLLEEDISSGAIPLPDTNTSIAEEPMPEDPNLEDPNPENPNPENPDPEDPVEPPVKQGLVEENGFIYYYNEDGTLFNGGYKVVETDGKRVHYYFQEDGTAYTDGYLNFQVNGEQYYFFFQEDGSAFTGGYKEVMLDGKLCYFYFLANGQGFKTGYKTVMIDDVKYYFYFGSDGQAVTDKLIDIPLGDRTAYMLFCEDGKAYTDGYKELAGETATDYYYFLRNGQAFTTGYKTVKIDDVTYYFFFEENGKAFTGGMKDVPFGNQAYCYFFLEDGKALTADWVSQDDGKHYFQANGRAARDAFLTIEESRYHFGETGAVSTGGWFCVGDGYYFADENGILSTDTIVGNYKLDQNGKSRTKYQILEYVNRLTNKEMTDQEKIDALYYWLYRSNIYYSSSYEHIQAGWDWPDGWIDTFASDMMNNQYGNCFKYAAFLSLMIREATGLPVTIYHGRLPLGSPHGWLTVLQDGELFAYDVQQARQGEPAAVCYKAPYPLERLIDGIGTELQ